MRRRLYTLLSVGSLLLGVVACVLWSQSFKGQYAFALERFEVMVNLGEVDLKPGDIGWNLQRELTVYRGTIGIHQVLLCPGHYYGPYSPSLKPGWHAEFYFDDEFLDPMPTGLHWKNIAAHCGGPRQHRANAEFRAGCPIWMVVLAIALIPASRVLLGLRAYRRGQAGRCASCGYDLRATPDRCPECGVVTNFSS